MKMPGYKIWMLIFLSSVFLSHSATAKVAYLPIIVNDFPSPSSNQLMVFDLESNQVLRNISIEGRMDYYETAIYLDHDDENLYVSHFVNDSDSTTPNRISRINTLTLEVEFSWRDLPRKPDRMLVSPDNSKLYFINLLVGTGTNVLYQIDLATDVISEVVRYPNSSIRQFVASENGSHFVLEVFNNNTSERQLVTFESNTLTAKYTITIDEYVPIFLLNDVGESIYYTDSQSDTFISMNLSKGTVNWTFSASDEEYFYSPYEKDPQTLVVSGINNTYLIDQVTGTGSGLFEPNENPTLRGSYARVDQDEFIHFEYPMIICITGYCSLSSYLDITVTDLLANSSNVIYQSEFFEGSFPIGRFVGENLFQGNGPTVQAVPLLNNYWMFYLMVMLLLIALVKIKSSKG